MSRCETTARRGRRPRSIRGWKEFEYAAPGKTAVFGRLRFRPGSSVGNDGKPAWQMAAPNQRRTPMCTGADRLTSSADGSGAEVGSGSWALQDFLEDR